MSGVSEVQAPSATPPAHEGRSLRELISVRRYGLQAGTVTMALLLWLLFAIGASGTWLQFDIYSSLMSSVPQNAGIMALALTIVVIAREIDLSFGSVMAVGAWVFIAVGQPELGLIAGVAAGLGVGLLNGIIVVRFGIPSLVATIGTWFFWGGIVLYGTGGTGAGTEFANGFVTKLLTGRAFHGYIPAEFLWMIGIAILLWVLLNRHRFGAHVYLVGDNDQSARMMGVRTGRVRIASFGLVGLCAGFAGIASTLESHYFWPTVGSGAMLPTVAAVFLGGTSIFGGRGTIFGTVIGAFVIEAIEPGIVSLGWTGLLTQVIDGAVIVCALVMQAFVMKRVRH